ncbi:MAG: hypothetical protein ACK5LR_12085 [Mangrovibacterium sp.]
MFLIKLCLRRIGFAALPSALWLRRFGFAALPSALCFQRIGFAALALARSPAAQLKRQRHS